MHSNSKESILLREVSIRNCRLGAVDADEGFIWLSQRADTEQGCSPSWFLAGQGDRTVGQADWGPL